MTGADTGQRRRAALLGLFRDVDAAAGALDALRAAGFGNEQIEILSDVPYPEGAFGEEGRGHHLHAFALAGAVLGIVFGLVLTIGTQLAYPLVTGGKPILSVPPMVNVIFETMMLGAISFTTLGVLFESRLPDFHASPYDPRITEGLIGVAVGVAGVADAAERDAAVRALREAGAVDVVAGGDEAGESEAAP